MSCITVGIHIGHEGGVAVASDGEILIACAEERLSRVKYANGWWNALRYCLDGLGIPLSKVDLVVFSNAGPRLPLGFNAGLDRWCAAVPPVTSLDHHLSHAIGAFAYSDFSEALVYVGDAGGNDGITESVYFVDSSKAELLCTSQQGRPRAKGIGTTYEAFTNFLGFTDQESGKTMALSAYGDANRWTLPLFEVNSCGQAQSDLCAPHQWGVEDFAKRRGLNFGTSFPETRSLLAQDIAAYIQHQFTDTLVQVFSILIERHRPRAIILSGGIGLNCVANSALRQSFIKTPLFFFPACSDMGLPVGNALYGQWSLGGRLPKVDRPSMLLGRAYSEDEINAALNRLPDTVPPGRIRLGDLSYYESSNISLEAAQLLADGKIIGWWQGRSEFGPRALGARSILVSPRLSGVREILNGRLKEREWFRPFGPSVLSNDVSRYFPGGGSFPYMIEAPRVNDEGRLALENCVHIDGTARVQTVSTLSQPTFSELLAKVKTLTGHAAVLNTSFNVREPIVESPSDAIATFLRSRIDALVLDRFICLRQ